MSKNTSLNKKSIKRKSCIDIEDHGNFVFVKPPKKIVGIDPKNSSFKKEEFFQGVFIKGREVKLAPYYIGKYEVTYKLWQEVYDWAISKGYNLHAGENGSYKIYEYSSNPVTKVSWFDCIVWCNAYTHKEKSLKDCVYRDAKGAVIKSVDNLKPSEVFYDQTKQGYRLPTEAEWEFAARFQGQDSTNALNYGGFYLTNLDSMSGACDNYENRRENERVAWFRGNSHLGAMEKDIFHHSENCFTNNNLIGREELILSLWQHSCSRAHPVGQKAANYAGLYDMSGNVMEWCYDGGKKDLATGIFSNPCEDQSNPRRITRSGLWSCFPKLCVVGFRRCWEAGDYDDSIGFRLACSGKVGWECENIPLISVEEYNFLVERLNFQLIRRQYLSNDPTQIARINDRSVNLLNYWKFLETLEKLVDISEASQKVYNSANKKLPKSYFDFKGNIVFDTEKIKNILKAAEKESLYGFTENRGDFIFFKPQSKIVGVDSQVRERNIRWEGVFISGRTIELSPYCIGKCTVTYQLWREVYNWNQQNNKGYIFNPGEKGSHGDERNTINDPVTKINWFDCIVWCNAYTEMIQGSTKQCVYTYKNKVIKNSQNLSTSKVYYNQTKKGYRLPTEAEWEYAARFQANKSINALRYRYDYLTRLDSFSGARGNHVSEIEKVAIYRGNSHLNHKSGKTSAVGEKFANYSGLYDMTGNVWEWCYDGWQDCLPLGTEQNPFGSKVAKDRVIRGGCWYDAHKNCQLGFRRHKEATLSSARNHKTYYIGLRLAYSSDDQALDKSFSYKQYLGYM